MYKEIIHLINQELTTGKIAGGQILYCKDGNINFRKCFGMADREHSIPMQNDTIFRMYSMSKPITAVIAMKFWECRLFDLEDPISKFLPEYKEMTVITPSGLQKATTPIKIKDLLNMTAGIVYPGEISLAELEMKKCFADIHAHIDSNTEYTTREVIKKIADMPLAFQPSTSWVYGLCADVLGGILEIIAQKSLRDIFLEELFLPLSMYDTDFYVPVDKQPRLAKLYCTEFHNGHSSLSVDNKRHLGLTFGLIPPKFESAGAGIFSTADDYAKFGMMLCGQGHLGNVQILKPKTIRMMTQNQLTPAQLTAREFLNDNNLHSRIYGYGFLMRQPRIAAECGWNGWSGTTFYANAEQNSFFLYLVQASGYEKSNLEYQLSQYLSFP